MLVYYTDIIILTSYKNISLARKEFLFDESREFFDEGGKSPHPINSNPGNDHPLVCSLTIEMSRYKGRSKQ